LDLDDDAKRSLYIKNDLTVRMSRLKPDNQSSLLALPGELRNIIYEHVFQDGPSGSKNLGLLLTCRQTNKETCSLAFEPTRFRVFSDRLAAKLRGLANISDLKDHVQSLKINCKNKHAHELRLLGWKLHTFRIETIVLTNLCPRSGEHFLRPDYSHHISLALFILRSLLASTTLKAIKIMPDPSGNGGGDLFERLRSPLTVMATSICDPDSRQEVETTDLGNFIKLQLVEQNNEEIRVLRTLKVYLDHGSDEGPRRIWRYGHQEFFARANLKDSRRSSAKQVAPCQ